MCYNAVVINRKPKTLDRDIRKEIIGYMQTNKDGYGVLRDDEIIRILDREEAVKFINKKVKCRVLHVHFRQATSGSITVDNVHLWRHNNFYFSHNGTVMKYSKHIYPYINFTSDRIETGDLSTCDLSDSRLMFSSKEFQRYFSKVVKEITAGNNNAKAVKSVKAIYNYLTSIGFYGIIMSTNTDYAVIISNKKFYTYYHKGAIVFSNMPLNLGGTEINGIHFRYEVQYSGVVVYSIKDNRLLFNMEHEPYNLFYKGWYTYEV